MLQAITTVSLCVAALAAAPALSAQTVYRCGNSYSDQPCPGGSTLGPGDTISEAQRERAKAATQRDRRTADSLEKERLAQEAAQARNRQEAERQEQRTSRKAAQARPEQAVPSPIFTARGTPAKPAKKRPAPAKPAKSRKTEK